VCVWKSERENYTGYVRYVCQRKSDTHSPRHTHTAPCAKYTGTFKLPTCVLNYCKVKHLKSTFETHFTSVRWQNSKIFNEDLFENWLDGRKCFYLKRQFEGRGLNFRGLDDVSRKGNSFQWRSKLVMKDYDSTNQWYYC